MIFKLQIKVMKKQTFIGIDISKKTLDLVVNHDQCTEHFQISNNPKAIRKFLINYVEEDLFIGMENTGRYNYPVYEVLAELKAKVFVIPPLHLKKSFGLIRGKNDKIDAKRILAFVQKNWTELKEWKIPSYHVQKLKVLLAERNSRIKMMKQLKTTQQEYELICSIAREENLMKMNNQLIRSLEKQILEIEEKIEQVIASDDEMTKHADMIKSVPGVGRVLCWVLIAKTDNFRSITNPRKLACYSGVVPFEHQSGTSIKRKERVSMYADKDLKSLLHLGAMSAIRLNNDLMVYYRRKVDEGKNKMSVLNAVRNKIIHRVYAVIRSQTPYVNYCQKID